MNFIKKHYEKVLLGAVLLGLVVAAVLLPFKVSKEADDLRMKREEITEKRPAPLPPLNLTRAEDALKRLRDSSKMLLTKPHNLFNPRPWQKPPDAPLVPVPPEREFSAEVTNIAPLYLTITLTQESPGASGYQIKMDKETEMSSRLRSRSGYVLLNVKPSILPLMLREVRESPGKPTELMLELIDTGERISIAFNRPFRRVDGYTADIRAENRSWPNQRVGSRLLIAGDEFTIVQIQKNPVATNQFEVVFSAKSTGKKHTVIFEKKDDEIQRPATKPGAP